MRAASAAKCMNLLLMLQSMPRYRRELMAREELRKLGFSTGDRKDASTHEAPKATNTDRRRAGFVAGMPAKETAAASAAHGSQDTRS